MLASAISDICRLPCQYHSPCPGFPLQDLPLLMSPHGGCMHAWKEASTSYATSSKVASISGDQPRPPVHLHGLWLGPIASHTWTSQDQQGICSSCDQVFQPASLGPAPQPQCSHRNGGICATGGLMQPIQKTPLQCLDLVTGEMALLDPRRNLLHKVTPSRLGDGADITNT